MKPQLLFKAGLLVWLLSMWGVTLAQNPNYAEVLQKSMFFYEAQRSGKLPATNRVNWRGDSGLEDGKDKNLDLTGGWYDAGDNMKFNYPMAASVTALAWGGIEYRQLYESTGQMKYLKENLKWVTDYFIRCHTAPNELWAQVGDPTADHNVWAPSEVATRLLTRPSYKIDATHPGSDLASETAAALAASSILFKDSDPAYSATLLLHARQLYAFADQFRGKYSTHIPGADIFYPSFTSYQDDLVWGAIWLYLATRETAFLEKAETGYDSLPTEFGEQVKLYAWTLTWEEKTPGIYCLLSKLTNKQKYKTDMERFLAFWTDGYVNEKGVLRRVPYTPGGLPYLFHFGPLRFAANTAFLAFLYSDLVSDAAQKNKYYTFARNTIDYMLGKNPLGISYVVGYGSRYPKAVHHRTAWGWPDGFAFMQDTCRHLMYGALVGGPDGSDRWQDDVSDFQKNDVACDYNALVTGAVARLAKDFGGATLANFPVPEIPTNEYFVEGSLTQTTHKVTLQGWVNNWSAWPARYVQNLNTRFFIDLSETVAKGLTANDYQIKSGTTLLALKPWDSAAHIYYFDVVQSEPTYPGGPYRKPLAITIELPNAPPGALDVSNDWSLAPLLNSTSTQNAGFYDADTQLWGKLPPASTLQARFTATPNSNVPLTVLFNASASVNPTGGGTLTYHWDFGDGNLGMGGRFQYHTYTTSGTYRVTLTIKNSLGETASVTLPVRAGAPCDLGTPRPTPLPSIVKSYNRVRVLGTGGPNLANVTQVVMNWDLANKGLWQFSIQTNNGQPVWWMDLRPKMTYSFDQPKPELTITGSGFPGLDGSYYLNLINGGDLVLVSKTGFHTLYFSEKEIINPCAAAARMSASIQKTPPEPVIAYPNPSASEVHVQIQDASAIESIQVVNQYGRCVTTLSAQNQTLSNGKVLTFGQNLPGGLYLIRVKGTTTIKNYPVIITR